MALPAGSRWLRANPPETSMMAPRLPPPSMSLRRRPCISGLPALDHGLLDPRLGDGAVTGAGDLHHLVDHRHRRLPRGVVGHGVRRGIRRQRTLLVPSAATGATLAAVAALTTTAATTAATGPLGRRPLRVRQQDQLAGGLDGDGHVPLVLGAVARDPTGPDLAA